tara:strand:- start:337 stop:564 length:228 start_codon:yes stop_codon:yes gene_type:complete
MWKVTYAIDTLDPKPDVSHFEEQWEALEFASDEMQRRVDFQVQHSPYAMSEEDVRAIEEHETQLIGISLVEEKDR